MILHRTILQAKIGKADEVVAWAKKTIAGAPDEQLAQLQPRILTDISGTFDTVVIETVHESLASYEQFRTMMLERDPNPEPGARLDMSGLIETGRNEYYTIEM